jgi:hypothetical protein
MTRRLGTATIAAAALVLLSLLVLAPIAAAHGIQGRADLPVPLRAFYWAAAIILVVSFVGLALGWRRPTLAALLERRSRPVVPGRIARGLLTSMRVASVLVLALVVATSLHGSTDLNSNFAPIWVFVVWWIGIALLAATVGDWWRAVHPVAVLARVLRLPAGSTGRLPRAFGLWPATVLLSVFIWLELVYPTAANVRLLGVLVATWINFTLLAMWRFGIDDTLDRVEPFSAYTRVLGGLGILGGRGDGTLELRPPVVGVLRQQPLAGLPVFMGLLLGSVGYDGLSRTLWWKQQVAEATVRLVERGFEARDAQLLLGSFGLVVMVLVAVFAFLAFAALARIVGRLPARSRYGSTAAAFAPSLVPIAVAYVVAHYASYFWYQSQGIIALASDPFGRDWNLFGTADFLVDYSTLTAEAIWAIQVVAIVVGHVLALVLAHDRALEIEAESPGARGVRSQWPMLALMVLYTIGGLYFLSEGLNS